MRTALLRNPASHLLSPQRNCDRMKSRARMCQKCGALTKGEEALVDGQTWCHPCADNMVNVPKILNAIADKVLAYRPKPKSKPARRRKRRKKKIDEAS